MVGPAARGRVTGARRRRARHASLTAAAREQPRPELRTIAREWSRIGLTGFGGPPAHIALLRRLVVERAHWLDEDELERAIAACYLLPGTATTTLAIFRERCLRGRL